MSPVAVLVLIVAVAVIWRLVRLVVRLAFIAAIIVAVVWYADTHIHHSAGGGSTATAGRVVHVTDGDTLEVITGHDLQGVRLLGIDAPESSSTRFGRPDCGGAAASNHMRQLADLGARVKLITDPRSGDAHDRYGRLLAYVIDHGQDLGRAQLTAGMAVIYRYDHRRFSRLGRYERAERDARRADGGVWRLCRGRFHAPAR